MLASLDLFIANLAFPEIARYFSDTPPEWLSWVLNSYVVVLAAVMIPAGALADRVGRRRLFRIGLSLYFLGSICSALAPTAAALIASRAFQGAGAAMAVPTSVALLLTIYPPAKHKRMVSVWAAVGSVAAGCGPVLGGLVAEADWRWVFVISMPISLTALACTWALHETERRRTALPDLFGCLLLALFLASSIALLARARTFTPESVDLWIMVGVAVFSLAAFLYRCITVPVPALRLTLFRTPSFALSTIGMGVFHIGFTGILLGCSLFLVGVWGWGTAAAGLGFALGPLTAAVAALIAGRISITPRMMTVVGGTALALSGLTFLLGLTTTPAYFPVFLVGMMLWGVGAGLSQTGFLAAGVSDLSNADYATGSAVINTARQVGSAAGNALVVAVVGTAGTLAAFTVNWAIVIAGGLATAACGLTLVLVARRPRRNS